MKEISLSGDTQADVTEASNARSRYLDDLLNIDNPYFERMVNQMYPAKLQLNNTNTSDIKASFLDLHLSILDGFLFHLKSMTNAMILISTLSIFHF